MASEKQVALVVKLLAERNVPAEIRETAELLVASTELTPVEFFKTGIVAALLAQPKLGEAPKAAKAELAAEGIYLVEGDVYQVATSKASGRRYAKVLDTRTGKFYYVTGAIYKIPADAQMVTIDQALDFGLKTGMCIKGHPLTDPLSIKLGIGPTCCRKMFGMTQAQLAKQRSAVKCSIHGQHLPGSTYCPGVEPVDWRRQQNDRQPVLV